MSHWHSGLPKLDIEPFDPTPLYDAVKVTVAENEVNAARRRSRLLPLLIGGGLAAVAGLVVGVVAFLG